MAKRPALTHTHLGRLKLAARCFNASDQETGDSEIEASLLKNI